MSSSNCQARTRYFMLGVLLGSGWFLGGCSERGELVMFCAIGCCSRTDWEEMGQESYRPVSI